MRNTGPNALGSLVAATMVITDCSMRKCGGGTPALRSGQREGDQGVSRSLF
jgi:hypothetical protein